MAKARIILLGLLAALALSAAATATASAHEYAVEGTKVTTAVEGTFTSGTSVLRGIVAKTNIEVVSTLSAGTFTLEEKGKSKYSVTFTGNKLYEVNAEKHLVLLSACGVTEKIEITNGKDTLLEKEVKAGEFLDTFEPNAEKGKVYVEFEITKCTLKGKYAAEGTANAFTAAGGTEKVLQNVVFSGEDQELKFATEPASFISTDSEVLNGANTGKKWGIIN
jgi:hypothetical protein